MKIGVIADTHIPESADRIPSSVYEHFRDVDLILHAGDLLELRVLDELRKISEVKAVFGNMDPDVTREALPAKQVIEVGRFRIGLIHGFGPPSKLMEMVRARFDRVEAIVYGHSHSPVNQTRRGILFFNPGSPTDRIFAPYNSCGILEVDDKIKGRIIRL